MLSICKTVTIYLDPGVHHVSRQTLRKIPVQHLVRKPRSRVTHLHEELELLDERHL